MSGAEFKGFLVELLRYGNAGPVPEGLQEVVDALRLRETAMIGGGVVAAKGDFRLVPGCCNGLESWGAWAGIKRGGPSPWMGHDPDPWIDTNEGIAVLHSDSGENGPSIEVSYPEIEAAFRELSSELVSFVIALEDWLASENINYGQQLCVRLKDWFWIGDEAEARADAVKEKLASILDGLKPKAGGS